MKNKKYPFTQNREISWLKFNQRVLEEAADPRVALLERLKFVAIFTSNLDEYFMVRAGSLMDLSLVDNKQIDAKSGLSPSEQLDAIYDEAKRLYKMRDNVARNLMNTLREVHIESMNMKNLNKKQTKFITNYFTKELAPLLAPQIIDVHHPFPFLINKELYIFFRIIEGNKTRYGIVPLPSYLPKFIYLNEEKTCFILTEKVILAFLEKLFPKAKIPFKTIIRVTRNADINLNAGDIEDDEDYRAYMKTILKKRLRLSPIRLEIYRNIDTEALDYLCSKLHLKKAQVFISKHAPLDPSYLFSIIENLPGDIRRALTYKQLISQTDSRLDPEKPLIDQILKEDVLLCYPYEDIELFIDLLRQASKDPRVLSISITIYRLAKNSQIVKYLCRAAENGKTVTVLMELRARFDEQNNIQAAERLEESGVNVFYGFEDYKVHSKLMQITLKDKDEIRTITQIGTGNYNEKTSRQYTDFSLMTADEEIGKDATDFFKNMNVADLDGEYKKIIVSPHKLKNAVMAMLDEQIERASQGKEARAWFKMNSLTDLDLIAKLAQASQAGVQIRMLVRGICCLLPGLPGYTDNIEIHSIVGRFLEHGRIYIFGPEGEEKVYISSADFMTRNTERRVEVGVPVEDPQLKQELVEYFDLQFRDNIKGRKLLPTGFYTKVKTDGEELIDSQEQFIELAKENRFVPKPQPQVIVLPASSLPEMPAASSLSMGIETARPAAALPFAAASSQPEAEAAPQTPREAAQPAENDPAAKDLQKKEQLQKESVQAAEPVQAETVQKEARQEEMKEEAVQEKQTEKTVPVSVSNRSEESFQPAPAAKTSSESAKPAPGSGLPDIPAASGAKKKEQNPEKPENAFHAGITLMRSDGSSGRNHPLQKAEDSQKPASQSQKNSFQKKKHGFFDALLEKINHYHK